MKKQTQIWISIISLAIAIVVILVSFGKCASWNVEGILPVAADSIGWTLYRNDSVLQQSGDVGGSRWTLATSGKDTTITVSKGNLYKFKWEFAYTGNNQVSWSFVRDERFTDTADIKTLATNNPSLFYGPTATGTGTDTITTYVVDTSGTDTLLSDVKVTMKDAGGSVVGVGISGANGIVTFYQDAGTYTVIAKQASSAPTMHFFTSRSLVLAGGNVANDTMPGYDMSIDAPTGSNGCTVYGYVYGPDNSAAENAEVFFELPDGFNDTCGGTIIGKFTEKTRTDTVGYFSQELFKSKCLENGTYTVRVEMKGGMLTKTKEFTIPDSSSFKLVW